MKKALKFSLWGGFVTSVFAAVYNIFLFFKGIEDYNQYVDMWNKYDRPDDILSIWDFALRGYHVNINFINALLLFLFFIVVAFCIICILIDFNNIREKSKISIKKYKIEKAKKQQEKAQQILDKYDNEQ